MVTMRIPTTALTQRVLQYTIIASGEAISEGTKSMNWHGMADTTSRPRFTSHEMRAKGSNEARAIFGLNPNISYC